jgi:hypothetical protein
VTLSTWLTLERLLRVRTRTKNGLAGALLAILGVGVLDVLLAKKLSSQKWSENDGNPMAPTTVGQPSGSSGAGQCLGPFFKGN